MLTKEVTFKVIHIACPITTYREVVWHNKYALVEYKGHRAFVCLNGLRRVCREGRNLRPRDTITLKFHYGGELLFQVFHGSVELFTQDTWDDYCEGTIEEGVDLYNNMSRLLNEHILDGYSEDGYPFDIEISR